MPEDFHGAKVALFLGDQLLVSLRDDFEGLPFPGQWDLPGGGRETSEDPWQTVSRETDEEVGLDLAPARRLWQVRTPAAQPGRMLWFFVAWLEPEAVRRVLFGDEGQAWALMAPERVLALDKLVAHHRPRLEHYHDLAGGWGRPVAAEHWDRWDTG